MIGAVKNESFDLGARVSSVCWLNAAGLSSLGSALQCPVCQPLLNSLAGVERPEAKLSAPNGVALIHHNVHNEPNSEGISVSEPILLVLICNSTVAIKFAFACCASAALELHSLTDSAKGEVADDADKQNPWAKCREHLLIGERRWVLAKGAAG